MCSHGAPVIDERALVLCNFQSSTHYTFTLRVSYRKSSQASTTVGDGDHLGSLIRLDF